MSSHFEYDTPPSSPEEEEDMNPLIMAMNAFNMSQDLSAEDISFHQFTKLPAEMQNLIWYWVSLSHGKTVNTMIGKETFKYSCLPTTPAFFHACAAARRMGQKHSIAIDAKGRLQDPAKPTSPYFYLNIANDEFILRFQKDSNSSFPVYCPAAGVAPDVRLLQEAREEQLCLANQLRNERRAEYLASATLPIFNHWTAATGSASTHNNQSNLNINTNLPPNVVLFSTPPAINQAINPPPPAPTLQPPAPRPRRDPDIPVFPGTSILPSFFPELTSIGLHLDLPVSDIDLSTYNLIQLAQWARLTLKPKLEKKIPVILERFPNLEYLFFTIRKHGLRNSDWRAGVEKKHWREVMLAEPTKGQWGRRECEILEMEIRRWLCQECMEKGGLPMKAELCLQWDTRKQ
jgi:hypothetical protein